MHNMHTTLVYYFHILCMICTTSSYSRMYELVYSLNNNIINTTTRVSSIIRTTQISIILVTRTSRTLHFYLNIAYAYDCVCIL